MSATGRNKAGGRGPWSVRPRWRISRGSTIAFGPGKADLLEAIGRAGSISAGARELGMSYRRAWLLVETMNECFVSPLVVTSKWRGGGARLTPAGTRILRLYRGIEATSEVAAGSRLDQVRALLKTPSRRT